MRFTRREFGAVAAGALAGAMTPESSEAAAAPATAVFSPACDCHVHIIGPRAKYPMVANRPYTPPEATVAQLKTLRTRLGIARNVIVQPSFYGTDNSCMLDAMAELGDTARGIAVVSPTIADAELRAMDAKGVRGVRINLESGGNRDPKAAAAMLTAMGKKVKPLNWHVQVFTVLPVIAQLTQAIADMPVPVVLDHFGMPVAAEGTTQRGFLALLDLCRARKVYVKLSAPYRVSKLPDYKDVTPLAQSLIYAARDRMLWATDWPHTQNIPGHKPDEVTPFSKIDDGAYMRLFNSWYPDETTRKIILVDNPTKLYRF
jgi:predicted TIM-barrel fold metal-dependent hydrolase